MRKVTIGFAGAGLLNEESWLLEDNETHEDGAAEFLINHVKDHPEHVRLMEENPVVSIMVHEPLYHGSTHVSVDSTFLIACVPGFIPGTKTLNSDLLRFDIPQGFSRSGSKNLLFYKKNKE